MTPDVYLVENDPFLAKNPVYSGVIGKVLDRNLFRMTCPYRMNMFQRDQVAVAPHKIPRSTDGRPKVVFLFFHHQPIVRTDGRTKVVFRAWYMVHGAWCMVHGAWCMMHGAWCMVRWTALHSPVTPCQMSHFRALWIAL